MGAGRPLRRARWAPGRRAATRAAGDAYGNRRLLTFSQSRAI